jgi:ammonia channel protein AmtB
MYFLYFDPGLGAMIAQAAIAAVAAVALFSKAVMFKIKSIFGLHKTQEEDSYDSIDLDENEEENDKSNPSS